MLTTYDLFGLRLTTSFPFATHLEIAPGQPGIPFEIVSEAPLSWDPTTLEVAYRSPMLGEDGETILRIYRLGEVDVLSFTEVADFYLFPEKIIAYPVKVEEFVSSVLVEIRLLGAVMAYLLEKRGMPALHASAVVIGNSAVGFLGSNRGGKTSLAASFVENGSSLLTDDILAVEDTGNEMMARSGYPQMRMWPPVAEHFLGPRWSDLPTVHPDLSKRRVGVGSQLGGWGRFCTEPRPLRRLYLPQRLEDQDADETIQIKALSPRNSVIELIRHSFLPTLTAGLGWEGRRLGLLSKVAEKLQVCRLTYPSGFQHLDRVRESVVADLGSGAG